MHEVLAAVSSSILAIISGWGYWGILVLSLLESAAIPIPSELILPFAGFLAGQGVFNIWLVIFCGAFGNLAGALISYGIARRFETQVRWFVARVLFFEGKDFERSETWARKYGVWAAFFSRLLPVVRTFISLPLGFFKAPLGRFALFTLGGSVLWSGVLAYAGYVLGENWNMLETYFREFDYIAVIIGLGVIGYWMWHKWSNRRGGASKM